MLAADPRNSIRCKRLFFRRIARRAEGNHQTGLEIRTEALAKPNIPPGWRSNGVVFWSSDDFRLETHGLPGRLLEYAFTGDHEIQGELCTVVKF
jgi:hypothetical protein